jgi:hypothetical protein
VRLNLQSNPENARGYSQSQRRSGMKFSVLVEWRTESGQTRTYRVIDNVATLVSPGENLERDACAMKIGNRVLDLIEGHDVEEAEVA